MGARAGLHRDPRAWPQGLAAVPAKAGLRADRRRISQGNRDMSGGGDSGGGSTQIEPWDQSKGHLISAMNRADRFMNGGVGFNPLTSANGVQAFRDYVGFDPGMQGNAYGLDPGQLQTGAITGVNP